MRGASTAPPFQPIEKKPFDVQRLAQTPQAIEQRLSPRSEPKDLRDQASTQGSMRFCPCRRKTSRPYHTLPTSSTRSNWCGGIQRKLLLKKRQAPRLLLVVLQRDGEIK